MESHIGSYDVPSRTRSNGLPHWCLDVAETLLHGGMDSSHQVRSKVSPCWLRGKGNIRRPGPDLWSVSTWVPTIKIQVRIFHKIKTHKFSVADPGFLSRIPDTIQKQQQKRGVKKSCSHTFSCSHKFHKIENYFSFEVLKKKIWADFQSIIELFTQKLSLSSQKYRFGIRDPEKPYSGSRIQG